MTTASELQPRMVGQAIKRREDPQLITGRGNYVDDIKLTGMTHAAVLRSPYAHANILSIDTSAALAHPGVLAVFTGKDMLDINPLPYAWQAAGVQNNVNGPRVLAVDTVHFAGEGVAVVVAEDRYIARDALELIEVEYEPLPVVVDAKQAAQPGAPQLHENAPNNVVFEWTCGDEAATNAAFERDDVVIVREPIINQRLIPTPMETRGAIGKYDPGTDEYTLWCTSQAPHVHRLVLAAFVLGVPEQKVRVIAPHVGGGFGAKIFMYADYPMVVWLSKKLGGRPVKYVEDRRDNYVATNHGRDHITDAEVAVTKDGKIVGLRVHTYANMGAYLSTAAGGIPTTLYGRIITGVYDIPAAFCRVYGTYTNTTFTDAYRGAGRPEASYLIERMMDRTALELGMDPAEIRRRNFIQPDQFPYQNAVGLLPYDSGNYEPTLDRALEMAGYANFKQEQEAARARGKYLGLGISTYVEICGIAPTAWITSEGWGAGLWESSNVKVHLTGKVVVTTGSMPHGQGIETSFAQIVSDELGVPYDDIVIEWGDTQGTPMGYGTYGSRSLAVGGTAMYKAVQKIKDKAKKIAAHMLEASEEDMEFADGKAFVKGSPDKAKTLGEIALAAAVGAGLPAGVEPFLDETSYYDPPNCVFPFGTHVAIVEVDADTGHLEVKRYIAVDDCGKVINPLIVDGQLHGGIVQGIAQAMYESAVYNEDGQLVSGSLMDYALPTAAMVPSFELDRTETPSPINPLGVKGAGEAGTIASAQAVVNATVNALQHLGIKHLQMPLTSERVWRAIHEAK
jgi:aerobic carbon-monoxide dehydrogenase large subunit